MVQLLDGGAEVNAKRDGDTSLILACHNGHVDAARLLLDRGGKAEDLVTRGGALCKGDAVEARRRRREKYYPCTITDDYGNGKYEDYGALGPEGYLELTAKWSRRFAEKKNPKR